MNIVKKHDTPDRVHGRLLESLHISGYSFERACHELKWLLRQDRWKDVSPGFTDVNKFLATMNLAEFRPTLEQRRDIVKHLAAIEASQRATARLLGVHKVTVARDLRSGANAPPTAQEIPAFQEIRPPFAGSCEIAREITASRGANAPRPYYTEFGITIYHGDCREILPTLPPGLMVTDPPYNVGYHYDDYHDELAPADYDALLGDVLTMPLVVIHYPEALFPLARRFVRSPDEIVAWVYHANTPKQWRAVAWFGIAPDLSLDSQAYRNPDDKRIRELIAQGRAARLYDWWTIEQVKNVSDEKTEHPCQIPKALMLRILQITPFDGPVIDPFCGSGTTLLAAQELGRPAIGIDSSLEYCDLAANRLRQRPLPLAIG